MPHKLPTKVTHGPLKDTDITSLSDGELVWLRGLRQEELDGILSGERICYAPWDNGTYYERPYSYLREQNPKLYRWVVEDAQLNLKAYDLEIQRREQERLEQERREQTREREWERQRQTQQQLIEGEDRGPWPRDEEKEFIEKHKGMFILHTAIDLWFKREALKEHPDHGGNEEKMKNLNRMRELLHRLPTWAEGNKDPEEDE